MHLFHIPQCSIENRNVHISVLNGALWDMEQVHSGICELGQLAEATIGTPMQLFHYFLMGFLGTRGAGVFAACVRFS